jgi:hypothetical protein
MQDVIIAASFLTFVLVPCLVATLSARNSEIER